MKNVPIRNKKIIEQLNKYKENCEKWKNVPLSEDKHWRNIGTVADNEGIRLEEKNHPVSQEYLEEALTSTDPYAFNFPDSAFLLSLEDLKNTTEYPEMIKEVYPINRKFMSRLGLEYNALIAMYPPQGYIGWHHNGRAAGLNVLFTYSENGNGYFEYRDPETKEIVRIQDVPGWQMKTGYYPSFRENDIDDLFWHCAYTDEWRLSVAFVVDDLNMREKFESIVSKES